VSDEAVVKQRLIERRDLFKEIESRLREECSREERGYERGRDRQGAREMKHSESVSFRRSEKLFHCRT
jgi:hypothetical protein